MSAVQGNTQRVLHQWTPAFPVVAGGAASGLTVSLSLTQQQNQGVLSSLLGHDARPLHQEVREVNTPRALTLGWLGEGGRYGLTASPSFTWRQKLGGGTCPWRGGHLHMATCHRAPHYHLPGRPHTYAHTQTHTQIHGATLTPGGLGFPLGHPIGAAHLSRHTCHLSRRTACPSVCHSLS